ncbi:MAG: hypothetical protein ABF301_04860 [Sulfurovum sp.]
MLTKLPKAYLVVENYSSKLNDEIKVEVLEILNDAATELNIDTSGYSHRSLAFILYETAFEGKIVLNVELVLGEMVKRVDDENQVFALTYQKRSQMSYENKTNEEIFELTVEKAELLIQDFIEQYKEDNL